MPVYKYKTFEAAKKALWNFFPDEAYFKRVAELWKFADQLSPIRYPHGVFKFKSIEDANRQRNEWELAHAKKLQSEREFIDGKTV